MIAYVDKLPTIDLHGQHFLLTVTSGDEDVQFMLTQRAFYILKARCAKADAQWRLAELDAREKVVQFPKAKRRKAKT